MDVSFNFNKATYSHKDYSLPVTDFQLLMTVHGVQYEPVNHLWNGAITDHHVMIENPPKNCLRQHHPITTKTTTTGIFNVRVTI